MQVSLDVLTHLISGVFATAPYAVAKILRSSPKNLEPGEVERVPVTEILTLVHAMLIVTRYKE